MADVFPHLITLSPAQIRDAHPLSVELPWVGCAKEDLAFGPARHGDGTVDFQDLQGRFDGAGSSVHVPQVVPTHSRSRPKRFQDAREGLRTWEGSSR